MTAFLFNLCVGKEFLTMAQYPDAIKENSNIFDYKKK